MNRSTTPLLFQPLSVSQTVIAISIFLVTMMVAVQSLGRVGGVTLSVVLTAGLVGVLGASRAAQVRRPVQSRMPSTGSSYVGHRAESTAPSDRVRRVVDVSLATLLLVAILPLLGAIAVLVKLSSRGPILIRQARIGFGGRVFYPTKFRTMYQSPVFPRGLTEHLLRSDPRVSADLAGLMLNHDPRLTPIGKLLRRSSLDELPTLVNVILGDMSLVGPRAPLPAEAGAEPSWAQVRYSVAPGLVSPTVLVTDHYDYEAMLALEVDYIQHFRSVQWDLRIIMETFRWSFAGGSLPLTDLGVEAAFVRTLLAKGGQRVANSTLEQVIDQMASA